MTEQTSAKLNWSGPQVDVVSLGVDTLPKLSDAAQQALAEADLIIGAEHHHHRTQHHGIQGDRVNYPSPLANIRYLLEQHQNKKITILASGDALFFGIGNRLIALVGQQHLRFHTNTSSIAASFHAVGLPWQDAKIVSLHGRPLSSLRRYLSHQAVLALFTDHIATPQAIGNELTNLGFSESNIWVCEAMGSDEQRVRQFNANSLASNAVLECHPLNIVIVQCELTYPLPAEYALPTFPGIKDEDFITGARPGFGMISKREVRLAVLSMMQPSINEIAWDLGAGCGSVSVEWARWNSTGCIYAIESMPERLQFIKQNAARYGVEQNCIAVSGIAPDSCADLPQPDCIFIGGSDGALVELLQYAWEQLSTRGKLVASAVTNESREILLGFRDHQFALGIQIEWTEIAVTKNLPQSLESRELMPVSILKCQK